MKKIVAGVLIMMVGVFLLLNKLGFFIPPVYSIVISWQSLLIAIGIILLFDRNSDHKTAGIVLILIGTLFLLSKFSPINVGSFIIPLIVIAVGIGIIVKSAIWKNENKEYKVWCHEHPGWKKNFKDFEKNIAANGGNIVYREYAFTSSKEKWTHGKLKNVKIEAVFSGVELDFTQAEMSDDIKVAAHIKVSSVFSGVILYVPEDWNIVVQKTGVFGGFTDNRPNRVLQVSSDKLVVLELEAVFGGGEIRCYE